MNTQTARPVPLVDASDAPHHLPLLPYSTDALEPYVDARTMTLHHEVHHAGYVTSLNAALAGLPELRQASALWLLCNLNQVADASRSAVHHAAGGHVNHSLFWESMLPGSSGELPRRLRDALDGSFGSVAAFKTGFENAGTKHFGSGWVWLVASQSLAGKLEIMTTAGHDHPAMKGRVPLLVNDVWEHAYYLRYESRRADYLRAWWNVVDWNEVGRRFDQIGQGGN